MPKPPPPDDSLPDPKEWAQNQTPTEPVPPTLEDRGEIRALKRDRERLRRKIDALRSGAGLIAEAVREAFEEAPPVLAPPPKPAAVGTGSEEVAILHLTDVQYGKRTQTYSSAVADDRIALMGVKTEKITKLRRHHATIRDCRLYLGGDIVEGESIFPGQAHEIDQSLFEQSLRGAPEAIANLVMHLLSVFETVHVVAVRGNHGRPGRKGDGFSRKTNWDTVCYRAVELMLLGPHAPKDMKRRLTMQYSEDEWFQIDRVMGWGNLLVHGDQIRGWAGLPWYGIFRKAQGWIDSLPKDWDYMWGGHFHTHTAVDMGRRTVLFGGSTESDNEYAQEQLGAMSTPKQRLAFFNAKHGLIDDVPLDLLEGGRVPNGSDRERWRDHGYRGRRQS